MLTVCHCCRVAFEIHIPIHLCKQSSIEYCYRFTNQYPHISRELKISEKIETCNLVAWRELKKQNWVSFKVTLQKFFFKCTARTVFDTHMFDSSKTTRRRIMLFRKQRIERVHYHVQSLVGNQHCTIFTGYCKFKKTLTPIVSVLSIQQHTIAVAAVRGFCGTEWGSSYSQSVTLWFYFYLLNLKEAFTKEHGSINVFEIIFEFNKYIFLRNGTEKIFWKCYFKKIELTQIPICFLAQRSGIFKNGNSYLGTFLAWKDLARYSCKERSILSTAVLIVLRSWDLVRCLLAVPFQYVWRQCCRTFADGSGWHVFYCIAFIQWCQTSLQWDVLRLILVSALSGSFKFTWALIIKLFLVCFPPSGIL